MASVESNEGGKRVEENGKREIIRHQKSWTMEYLGVGAMEKDGEERGE